MYGVDGQIIYVSYKRIEVKRNYILPTIGWTFSFSSKSEPNVKSTDLIIKTPILKLSMKGQYPLDPYLNISTVSAVNQVYTWQKNGDSTIEFHLPLHEHLLSEIERIRSGGNLNLHALISVLAVPKDKSYPLEEQEYPFDVKFAIPKSEWNELILPELNRQRIISITFPIIELPGTLITDDIMQYIAEANKALNDGRYDDVFGECRKALSALYNGVQKWAEPKLTDDDKKNIESSSGKAKEHALRNMCFSRLVKHEEKAKRINQLRNSLHQYASLDPHSPDHHGIEFTRDDAISVCNMTSSFISGTLSYMIER